MMKRFALFVLFLALSSAVYAQDSLSTTACPGAGCVSYDVSGQGTVGIQVSGTFSGTLTFTATVDGTNYSTFNVTPLNGGTQVSTTTGTGIWTATTTGLARVRVAFTSYASGTAVTSRVVSLARTGIASGLSAVTSAAAGTYLVATTPNVFVAVAPAVVHASPANQTGNATATFKMNGLGAAAAPCVATPVATGRLILTISGQMVQSTTADGVTIKLAEGTGTPPANAAAASGTVVSATQTWTALTGQLTSQFSVTATVTGLALNTAVWFDLQLADVTGGTASVTNIDCTAVEV